MREKFIKYKWFLAIIGIIILNIGWMVYEKQQFKERIQISEEPIQDTVESQLVDEVTPTLSHTTLDQNGLIPIEEMAVNSQQELDLVQEKIQVPVYICGEVVNQGVYYVDEDAIINEVIKCAGGLTRDADATVINLASPIRANEKIIIPKLDEEIDKLDDSYENRERIETLPSSQSNLQPSMQSNISHSLTNTISLNDNTGLVNINTATKSELMSLSGIGEVKAEAIISYREEQGGFKSIEEIMQISGIGEKTFEKLKPFITA